MLLIIDTFEVPALLISQKLFRSTNIIEIERISKKIFEEIASKDEIYCIHKECIGDELRLIKYYFNEIVEVFTNVQYIMKKLLFFQTMMRTKNASSIISNKYL